MIALILFIAHKTLVAIPINIIASKAPQRFAIYKTITNTRISFLKPISIWVARTLAFLQNGYVFRAFCASFLICAFCTESSTRFAFTLFCSFIVIAIVSWVALLCLLYDHLLTCTILQFKIIFALHALSWNQILASKAARSYASVILNLKIDIVINDVISAEILLWKNDSNYEKEGKNDWGYSNQVLMSLLNLKWVRWLLVLNKSMVPCQTNKK